MARVRKRLSPAALRLVHNELRLIADVLADPGELTPEARRVLKDKTRSLATLFALATLAESIESQKKRGGGRRRTATRADHRALWRALARAAAEEKWKRNPHLSASQLAGIIIDEGYLDGLPFVPKRDAVRAYISQFAPLRQRDC